LRIYTLYGGEFGERVLGNLANLPKFCIACGLACTECRAGYGSFVADIFGARKAPEVSQHFIDNPEEYLPTSLPDSELILAIGIHPDLLAELPSVVAKSNARAVIVPIEDRLWCPPRLREELRARFTEMGVESAFPKPFCELEATGRGVIDEFVKRYRIGKPSIEIELENDRITKARVLQSAPCGSTWYVAEQIKWHSIQDMSALEQVVSKAHHGYPCTASMETDPELNDTILHKSGYIIRDAVREAAANAQKCQVVLINPTEPLLP